MSQHGLINYKQSIWQQQKQLVAVGAVGAVVSRPNTGFNIKVAKPQTFDRAVG